jgi:hypothetical protein
MLSASVIGVSGNGEGDLVPGPDFHVVSSEVSI